jgi:GTP-binding protein
VSDIHDDDAEAQFDPVAAAKAAKARDWLIEDARRLFTGPIEFKLSAPALEFLPPPDVAEIAFAGRSNVGKSTLLNALTGRHGLARASNTPGRTQELNFFDVGEPRSMRLVDMPGYGYAEAPKDLVARWKRLIFDYLRGRVVLKRVLVLIDARHGLKAVDLEILGMLDKAAVSYQADRTGQNARRGGNHRAHPCCRLPRSAGNIGGNRHRHPRTAGGTVAGGEELRACLVDAVTYGS